MRMSREEIQECYLFIADFLGKQNDSISHTDSARTEGTIIEAVVGVV